MKMLPPPRPSRFRCLNQSLKLPRQVDGSALDGITPSADRANRAMRSRRSSSVGVRDFHDVKRL